MFQNEVLIDKDDKERLIELISEVNEILEKYQYNLDYYQHTVVAMNKAQFFCKDLLKWCSYLYTNEDVKGEQ